MLKQASRIVEEERRSQSGSGLSSKTGSVASLKDPGSGTSSRATSSPTDQIMSPISKKLLSKKTHSVDENESMKLKKVNLNLADIPPMPLPAPQLDFILGTSSKFRKSIIDQLGWKYTQMSPDIDEKAIRTEDPIDLPIRIAEAKARAIIEQLKSRNSNPNNIDINSSENPVEEKLILTADQIVLFDQEIREKPTSDSEALAYLSSYSEKSVSTVSAIVITHYPSELQYSGFDIATVHWKAIPEEVVKRVVAKGEIFQCAGGFRIEDEDLSPLIHSIDGPYDSVLGLPIKLTINLMAQVLSYLDELNHPDRLKPINDFPPPEF